MWQQLGHFARLSRSHLARGHEREEAFQKVFHSAVQVASLPLKSEEKHHHS